MKAWVKKLPKSQIELAVETEEPDVAAAEEKALRKAANYVDIPGFRPGKAPLNFVREKLKKEFLVKETIEILKDDVFRAAVEKENLQVIDQPEVKIEDEKSLPKFKFKFSVWPEVKLGDYKKALAEIKSGKKIETAKSLAEAQRKATEEKKEQKARAEKLGKQTPEEQKEKLEGQILQVLLATAEVEIPDILIESEVEGHLLPAREEQIKRLGLSLENYLKVKQGKSLAKYRQELQQEAERIVKLRLILQKLAEVEQPEAVVGELEEKIDLGYIMDRLKKFVGS